MDFILDGFLIKDASCELSKKYKELVVEVVTLQGTEEDYFIHEYCYTSRENLKLNKYFKSTIQVFDGDKIYRVGCELGGFNHKTEGLETETYLLFSNTNNVAYLGDYHE